jgi:hypothetical protein
MTDREVIEKFIALVSSCPVGYAHGHVVTHRAFQEQDLIDWLDALHALREQAQLTTKDTPHAP